MSRQIDPKKIANGTLDLDEEKYLAERGLLPLDYQVSGAAELESEQGQFEEVQEEVEKEADSSEQGTAPQTEEDKFIEDYEEGWNNRERRAELHRRGLSVEGGRDELIARLKQSDLDDDSEENQEEEENEE